VADDIRDVAADPVLLGKPVGRDLALGRPSAGAASWGLAGARALPGLVERAVERARLPRRRPPARAGAHAESERLVPQALCEMRWPR
jgi:geranylgeranyl diphosphate synthase, type II